MGALAHAEGATAGFWAAVTALALLPLLPLPPWLASALAPVVARGKTSARAPQGPPGAAGSRLGRRWAGLQLPRWAFDLFYPFGLACCTAAIACHWLALARSGAPAGPELPALCLLWVHVSRRLAEVALATRHAPGARVHLMVVVPGLMYYFFVPVTVLGAARAAAEVPAAAGGGGAGRGLGDLLQAAWGAAVAGGAPAAAGLALFALGQAAQAAAHRELAALRGPRGARGGEYPVPGGWLFRRVCCPHYTAEVATYAGITLVAGGWGGAGRSRGDVARMALVSGGAGPPGRGRRAGGPGPAPGDGGPRPPLARRCSGSWRPT